ncbi:MAG TPA: DUF3570 domain-containing protein, partial [Opitutaceae bacterium]
RLESFMTPHAQRNVSSSALLAAALALCLPRPSARADSSIAYKFENYREEDGRITVETQSAEVNQDFGSLTHLTLTDTIDAISGATPTGQPAPAGSDLVPETNIHERRKAWNGDLSVQVKNVNLDFGFADSRESDYVSQGWSINSLVDLNQKNTTLRLGVAGTSDQVEIFFLPGKWEAKHSGDAILGVTQLLDPLTFVTVNVTIGEAKGYLAEPHKFVEKEIEVFPGVFLDEAFGENSPGKRNKETVFASINRAFPAAKGAVEASYRFYSDSFGITANTVELSWIQHVGSHLDLQPMVRLYEQSAANFYYYDLDTTPIIPVHVPTIGSGPFYTSDLRLSSMDTYAFGLTATCKVSDRVRLDLAYQQYNMYGRDGVTPASAYPRAGVTTAGIRFSW